MFAAVPAQPESAHDEKVRERTVNSLNTYTLLIYIRVRTCTTLQTIKLWPGKVLNSVATSSNFPKGFFGCRKRVNVEENFVFTVDPIWLSLEVGISCPFAK